MLLTCTVFMQPLADTVYAIGGDGSSDRHGRFDCLVVSCKAKFRTSQARDKHADRHFRPRILCPGGCGRWFEDLDLLRTHSTISRACLQYLKEDSVVYQARVRWDRCPGRFLRQPAASEAQLPKRFTAEMELDNRILTGRASWDTSPPPPTPVWPRRPMCKLPRRAYARAD